MIAVDDAHFGGVENAVHLFGAVGFEFELGFGGRVDFLYFLAAGFHFEVDGVAAQDAGFGGDHSGLLNR